MHFGKIIDISQDFLKLKHSSILVSPQQDN